VSFAPAQGPTLEPDKPFNIFTGLGDMVRVDDTSTSAYLAPGNGSLPSEQFRAYNPLDSASTVPLKPGAAAIIKSEVGRAGAVCRAGANMPWLVAAELALATACPATSCYATQICRAAPAAPTQATGMFCQLVPGPTPTAPSAQAVRCDVATAAEATPLTYTGSGFTYNGQPMVPTGAKRTLLINSGSNSGFVAGWIQPPPLVAVTSAGVYSILVGGACRQA
jgi:hypothetical protein